MDSFPVVGCVLTKGMLPDIGENVKYIYLIAFGGPSYFEMHNAARYV